MMSERVSVVIPFFNANQFIHETLLSILNQAYLGEIIIVVDHQSHLPDLGPLAQNDMIKIIYNRFYSRGPGVCRSIGFNAAKCKYVAFLDSDDVWHENRLLDHVSYIRDKDLAFSFTRYSHFDSSGVHSELVFPPPFNFKNFLRKRFTIGCLTVIIDKSLFNFLPPICIRRRNDYLLWHYVLNQCEKRSLRWGGYPSESSLAYHRLHDSSLTQSRIKSAYAYFLYLHASGHSMFSKLIYFFFYFYYTIGTR